MEGLTESATLTRDNLITGDFPLVHKPFNILAGNLKRGTVLGLVLLGAVASAAKDGGNTGNGTLVVDATTPRLANCQAGVYTARCVAADTHEATFQVRDPRGRDIGTVSFSGSGASGTFANEIKFAVTDGSTDFIVGDGFDITVAAGSGGAVKSLTTASDGSQNPVAILAAPADATAGAIDAPGYISGQFDPNLLDLADTGHTEATLASAWLGTPIFLRAAA
ncbi:hypothetical protein [Parvibaculum sp.]|uniref:hypothetical protein n=1 Tax=Parvibaculum sp. TaxID=2024848 RepID=UPI001D2C6082|nr:hypothetical protein [Parvibaculum sp.]MBX3488874.1 hypothetical protein [Parvibaculum sp.]